MPPGGRWRFLHWIHSWLLLVRSITKQAASKGACLKTTMRQLSSINWFFALVGLASLVKVAWGWGACSLPSRTATHSSTTSRLYSSAKDSNSKDDLFLSTRRSFVVSSSAFITAAAAAASCTANAADDENFESIAARAAKMSKTIEQEEDPITPKKKITDLRTAYDFTLPIAGKPIPFEEMIHQETLEDGKSKRVKAILVVNIKQDDIIARKNIPEMIALAAK